MAIIKYTNGARYEGEVRNGKSHGRGIYYRADGSIMYDGEYKDGTMNGSGKYYMKSGNVYEGEFKDGNFHGKGKLTSANGDCYEGDFENDVQSGYGKTIYANGCVYEGNIKENKRHGQGKYTFEDGRCYDGEWQEGKMHGKGIMTYPDGREEAVVYENGNCVERSPLERRSVDMNAISDWQSVRSGEFAKQQKAAAETRAATVRQIDMSVGMLASVDLIDMCYIDEQSRIENACKYIAPFIEMAISDFDSGRINDAIEMLADILGVEIHDPMSTVSLGEWGFADLFEDVAYYTMSKNAVVKYPMRTFIAMANTAVYLFGQSGDVLNNLFKPVCDAYIELLGRRRDSIYSWFNRMLENGDPTISASGESSVTFDTLSRMVMGSDCDLNFLR